MFSLPFAINYTFADSRVDGVSSTTNTLLIDLMMEITKTKQEKVKKSITETSIATIQTKYTQEKEIEGHNATSKSSFHKDEGPFIKALDKALASFNIQRQAYHWKSCTQNTENNRHNIIPYRKDFPERIDK